MNMLLLLLPLLYIYRILYPGSGIQYAQNNEDQSA